MRTTTRAVISALILGGLSSIPSFATAITGTANITGAVSVSALAIDFSPTFSVPALGTETGSFAGLTGGTIQSLSGGPATGSVNIPDFIVFNMGVNPAIHFNLTTIQPGVGTNAACIVDTVGSECTPTGSPFTLVQGQNTVGITLTLDGLAYTGTTASGSSMTTGAFTTQDVVTGTITGILQTLATGGQISGDSYSAAFIPVSATTPEPASLLLMGVGLFGAGIIARKKIRSK